MGKTPRLLAETAKTLFHRAVRLNFSRSGFALAWSLLFGCLGCDNPLLSAKDSNLQPALETLHTVASTGFTGDSIPNRLIESHHLMAGLIWAEAGDTLYLQVTQVNREWPMRLEIPIVSTPPSEALMNVAGNGRGRFGVSLLFLFEDVNGNSRYESSNREAGELPLSGEDWLWGMAGAARILFISDSEALEWVRAHPPKDLILTVLQPSLLRVGFNLLNAVHVRDTVFHEYKISYSDGGFSLSNTPPDSGAFETLYYPKKICDGFNREEWSREIPLSVGVNFNPFDNLVLVNPILVAPP